MRFAITLLLGGICAVGIGLWWCVDGLIKGPANQLSRGLIWGLLLVLVGAGALAIGGLILREISSAVDDTEQRPPADAQSSG